MNPLSIDISAYDFRSVAVMLFTEQATEESMAEQVVTLGALNSLAASLVADMPQISQLAFHESMGRVVEHQQALQQARKKLERQAVQAERTALLERQRIQQEANRVILEEFNLTSHMRFNADFEFDLDATMAVIMSMTDDEVVAAHAATFTAIIDGYSFPNRFDAKQRVTRHMLPAFLNCLPLLVEKFGASSNAIKRLAMEIASILRLCPDVTIVYPTAQIPEGLPAATIKSVQVLHNSRFTDVVTRTFPMCNQATIYMSPILARQLDALAALGGSWSVYMDAVSYVKMTIYEPVKFINTIFEVKQAAAAISFKTKMGPQQLKILQAFFRNA